MKSLQLLKTLLPGLVILLSGSSTMGQEKFNISAGVGFPEMLNLGLRYQFGNSQVGVYGGIVPGLDYKIFSMGADYYYHYGGSIDFSTRPKWFGKAGLNYSFQEETHFRYTYLMLVPRIGREFNLSRRMGLSLEGGLYIVVSHSEIEIKPGGSSEWGGPWLPQLGPSFSVNVFYRL